MSTGDYGTPSTDLLNSTCCSRADSQAFNYDGPIAAVAQYCPTSCVAICYPDVSLHCCEGSPNDTMPTTTTTTTPAPTTTTPDVCTDCTCSLVTYGSYGSRKLSKRGHYCCSRSDSPQIDFRGPIADYSYFCPTMCVARCGGIKTHCCEGIPTHTKAPGASSSCFPSTASVNLQNGKSVTMSDLQIGDKVQTGTCISFICL